MTREEAIEYEASLHRRYFEPFDRLLEKKAQYYLDKADEGKEMKPLLQEIEVMERFREYAAMLETLLQDAIDGQHRLGLQITYLKHLFRYSTHAAADEIRRLKCLQEQCQQP